MSSLTGFLLNRAAWGVVALAVLHTIKKHKDDLRITVEGRSEYVKHHSNTPVEYTGSATWVCVSHNRRHDDDQQNGCISCRMI